MGHRLQLTCKADTGQAYAQAESSKYSSEWKYRRNSLLQTCFKLRFSFEVGFTVAVIAGTSENYNRTVPD
jgi:hypothetical protein